MDIPGKLREDLKRIYGVIDPLDCVEDIVATESCRGTELVVTLRVPARCERYMPQSFMSKCSNYTIERTLEQGALERAMVMDIMRDSMARACEPPRVTRSIKPERVFFNGDHTTLVWPEGDKTVVGVAPGEKFDEYTGFCAAIVKRLFGSSREAKKFLDSIKVVQKKKEKKK